MLFESLDEVIDQLEALREKGYIRTNRTGNTGVGKTLEDELGIEENNDEEADILIPPHRRIELKSIRERGDSPLTLFSKEPPNNTRSCWARDAIAEFGYEVPEKDRRSLYTTLQFDEPNAQGLYTTYRGGRLAIVHTDYGVCAYYPQSTLRTKFEDKFPEIIVVTAKTRGEGARELFWYTEAVHMSGFNVDAFFDLLEQGDVVVETRMHLSTDGEDSYRNHGTAWRVQKTDVPKLFSEQTNLFDESVVDGGVDVQTAGQQFIANYV